MKVDFQFSQLDLASSSRELLVHIDLAALLCLLRSLLLTSYSVFAGLHCCSCLAGYSCFAAF